MYIQSQAEASQSSTLHDHIWQQNRNQKFERAECDPLTKQV